MTKGRRFTVRGFFESSQFYPQGNSDADTLNVKVAMASFVDENGKEKSVFGDLQKARYDEKQPAGTILKKRVMASGGLRVRLQGIDAPELHYRVKDTFYRQPRGAYAARRLNEALRFYSGDAQPCEIVTRVDSPAQAFDIFGRLVGDVFIGAGMEKQNINLQLLREGLAVPTFYDSMEVDEINVALDAARRGRAAQDSIWKQYTAEMTLDQSLVSPHPGSPIDVEKPDLGLVILPKLFRRLSTHILAAGGSLQTFKASLAQGNENGPEKVRRTAEFLSGQGSPIALADFIDSTTPDRPLLSVDPGDLIFLEAPGQLWLEVAEGKFEPWN